MSTNKKKKSPLKDKNPWEIVIDNDLWEVSVDKSLWEVIPNEEAERLGIKNKPVKKRAKTGKPKKSEKVNNEQNTK